jgi:phosphoglycolate phosphatase
MDITNYDHIIWDWNGTLLDDVDACVEALNRLLDNHGVNRVTVDAYRNLFSFPVKDYYIQLGFDFSRTDWVAVAHEFHAHYAKTSRTAKLHTRTVSLLEELHGSGMPMTVLSASESGMLNAMIDERGIRGYFRGLYGRSDFYAESKFDTGARLVAEQGIQPERALLIGDTTHDFQVAGELGFQCLLLSSGHQTLERLQQCGCPVRGGLDDIFTGAGAAA